METNSEAKLAEVLFKIFSILAEIPSLNFVKDRTFQLNLASGKNILRIDSTTITQLIPSRTNHLFGNPSPLEDQLLGLDKLSNLVKSLSKHGSGIYFDHVGFCYQVASQAEERQQLITNTKSIGLNLYEIPSNDAALWLFLGNTANWKDPMIEYLPVEKTSDPEKDYWLPNLHIDINTPLDAVSLETEIRNAFGSNTFIARSCVIDNIIYTVRLRLGVISGVNVDLDLCTKAENLNYVRKNVLKTLINNIVL